VETTANVGGDVILRPSHALITYRIVVRGKAVDGQRFIQETTVTNPGKSTLYFSLDSKVFQGCRLLVIISLPVVGRLALRCITRRVDVRPNGNYAVLAKITRYRSL
jgi:hypothetical protein